MNQKAMYDGLRAGKRYTLKSEFLLAAQAYADGTRRYFIPCANISADKKYIFWQHYGSSAVKMNARNLGWLLKTIFKAKAADFIETPEF